MQKRKTNAVKQTDSRYSKRNHEESKPHYTNESKTIDFNQAQPKKAKKPIDLIPQTVNQEKYIVALTDPNIDIVVANGPAGTGKSYLATLAAISAYRSGEVERIVLCRPKVSIEAEDHGFLPGDLISKMAPWVRPITDILREFYTLKEIDYMLSEEIIEFAPLGFIRGRTFKKTFLILDEAQNSSPMQVKSLLTRIGNGSKFVLNGDTDQADRHSSDNGLLDLGERLKQHPVKGISVCDFTKRDIQRHYIISDVLELYKR